ncbi:cysteine-rich CWC family protein [Nitrospira sp. KM1]|uniref:cysteine-rich CWC family protein n=1 Tax=Nitrospira sp. KM1 TaxID=1936990 RepID=UPI00351A60E0
MRNALADSDLDPSRCPLCRQWNECALAKGKSTCWCFELSREGRGGNEMLQDTTGLSCLCRHCLTQSRQSFGILKELLNSIRSCR